MGIKKRNEEKCVNCKKIKPGYHMDGLYYCNKSCRRKYRGKLKNAK